MSVRAIRTRTPGKWVTVERQCRGVYAVIAGSDITNGADCVWRVDNTVTNRDVVSKPALLGLTTLWDYGTVGSDRRATVSRTLIYAPNWASVEEALCHADAINDLAGG